MRNFFISVAAFLLIVVAPIVIGAQRSYVQAPPVPTGPSAHINASVEVVQHRFPCGDAICAGLLYTPKAAKPPLVVMAGGFAGTQDVALPGFATALAEAGVAAFTFDYRYFGASGGSPRQLVNPWHQLDDWKSAITYASALDAVEGRRVALLGASLGGGHALIAAHEHKQVSAVMALVPLVDSSMEGSGASLDAAQTIRLLFSAWGDLWLTAFGAEPVTLPAIARKGEFAMLSDDSAYAAFQSLASRSQLYRNEVLARSIFTFDDYNPAVRAAGLRKPLLVLASRADRFAPFEPARAFAAENGGKLEELTCDHFDVYAAPCAESAKAALKAFARELWPVAVN